MSAFAAARVQQGVPSFRLIHFQIIFHALCIHDGLCGQNSILNCFVHTLTFSSHVCYVWRAAETVFFTCRRIILWSLINFAFEIVKFTSIKYCGLLKKCCQVAIRTLSRFLSSIIQAHLTFIQ